MVLIGVADILSQKEAELKFAHSIEKSQNYADESQ